MTIPEIIKFLRVSMQVADPEGTEGDKSFLSLTDEELELYLKVSLSRNFPEVPLLELVPNEGIYPLVLLTRKDLYFTLATSTAPLYDIGADNNNYLKRSQRFKHYMELIGQVDKEYQDYLDNGGAGGFALNTYYAILPNRYNTRYNYEKGKIPKPVIILNEVEQTFVELSWKVQTSRFYRYRVYISTEPIVDLYNVEGKHISETANLVATIMDVHQTYCRIEDLEIGTKYFVAVEVIEKSTLTGYAETSFITSFPATEIPTVPPLPEGDAEEGSPEDGESIPPEVKSGV